MLLYTHMLCWLLFSLIVVQYSLTLNNVDKIFLISYVIGFVFNIKNRYDFYSFFCSYAGYYMLITAKPNLNISSAARLISFPRPAGQVICVSFFYHIFGNSIGTCFTVYGYISKHNEIQRYTERKATFQHFLRSWILINHYLIYMCIPQMYRLCLYSLVVRFIEVYYKAFWWSGDGCMDEKRHSRKQMEICRSYL